MWAGRCRRSPGTWVPRADDAGPQQGVPGGWLRDALTTPLSRPPSVRAADPDALEQLLLDTSAGQGRIWTLGHLTRWRGQERGVTAQSKISYPRRIIAAISFLRSFKKTS